MTPVVQLKGFTPSVFGGNQHLRLSLHLVPPARPVCAEIRPSSVRWRTDLTFSFRYNSATL